MVNKLPRSNFWCSKMLFFASEASDENEASEYNGAKQRTGEGRKVERVISDSAGG
jgi:hypothetical protein